TDETVLADAILGSGARVLGSERRAARLDLDARGDCHRSAERRAAVPHQRLAPHDVRRVGPSRWSRRRLPVDDLLSADLRQRADRGDGDACEDEHAAPLEAVVEWTRPGSLAEQRP